MWADSKIFWRSMTWAICVLGFLLGAEVVSRTTSLREKSLTSKLLLNTMKQRGLNAEDREAETAGYYQGILNSAANVTVRAPGALGRTAAAPTIEKAGGGDAPRLEELRGGRLFLNEAIPGFRLYRPRPNLDLFDPSYPGVRHVTNANGYVDRMYPVARSPGVRRIAILGDSVSRGWGVALGQSYEALLEEQLAKAPPAPPIVGYEVLNFAVHGYRATQMVDLAREEVAAYKPDVYVLALTWLSFGPKWGLHLSELFENGVDLKYEGLRDVARSAGLKRGDSERQYEAKLAPFMVPTMKWAVRELRELGRADGADVVVLLLPHPGGISRVGRREGTFDFDATPVRRMLEEEGVPYVDLLDVFDNQDDLTRLSAPDDRHPNARGHRMLEERLYQRIISDSVLSGALLGPGPPPATTPTP